MVTLGDRKLAVGIDARTRGFDAAEVLGAIRRLRTNPALRVELVYARADEATLMRRFTETRRRHPLAPQGRVSDGIAAEQVLTDELRQNADLVVDTSDLPLAALRQLIERHFGASTDREQNRMVVALMSFGYPRGLPPEADLVFDARFLRNPYYDPILRTRTGLDPVVASYVEADPDFAEYFTSIVKVVELVLPRFVQEGKKYATITIGCTGGRHRSVHLVEKLAKHLMTSVSAADGDFDGGRHWRLHVNHRELAREGSAEALKDRSVAPELVSDLDTGAGTVMVQPREA
jgi:UPF0042 nucleotide-binding protein